MLVDGWVEAGTAESSPGCKEDPKRGGGRYFEVFCS